MKTFSIAFATTVALAAASPAAAASADYYLVIDGVDGESTVAAKVSNWSFGASNPTSTSSGASGRSDSPLYVPAANEHVNPLAETKHTVKSPRDAASGQATGRRNGELQAADFKRGGKIDFAEASQADELGALSISLPSNSDAATLLCGNSDHLRSGHLVRSDGATWDLATMKGGRCAAGGGGSMTVTLTGSMKHNKTGHVTLMK